MEFMNYSDRNFDKVIEEFWSKDYIKLRSIFSLYDAISPFPFLNVKDDSGLTAINYAACTNQDPTFKCLRALMEISFVRLRDNIGRTLFHEICNNIRCQDEKLLEKILQKLIDYGVSKYAKDNDGNVAYEGSDIWGIKRRLANLSHNELSDYRKPVEFSNKNFAGHVMEQVRGKYYCIHESLSTIPGALKSANKTDIVKFMEEIPKETRKFFEVCGYDESMVENEPFYSELKETTSRLLMYNYENLQSCVGDIIRDINSLFEPTTGLIDTLSKTLYNMKLQSLNTTAKPRELANTKQKVTEKVTEKVSNKKTRGKRSLIKNRSSSSSIGSIAKRPRDKFNDVSENLNKKKKKIESVSNRSSSSSDRTDNSRSGTQSSSSSPSKTSTGINQQVLKREIKNNIATNNCEIELLQVDIDEICENIEQLQQRIAELSRDRLKKQKDQKKYKTLNLELKQKLGCL